MKKPSVRLSKVAWALVILLGLRALGQLASIFLVGFVFDSFIYLLLGGVYATALGGIVKHKSWAPVLVIVLSAFDALASLMVLGGPQATGALIMDAVLIVLAVLVRQNHPPHHTHDHGQDANHD